MIKELVLFMIRWGGMVWDKSLKSTAWGARLAIVGWASNVQPSVKTNYTLIKGLTILGCRAGESARRGFVNQRARMKHCTNGQEKEN